MQPPRLKKVLTLKSSDKCTGSLPVLNFKQFTAICESADAALKKKADKSGYPLGILKQVYKRGVAAWKVGHKPGTTPQQWGMARVNSFMTGGRTRVKGDPDLWAKVKGKIRK